MSNWQDELAQGFSSSQELMSYLGLPFDENALMAENKFKTKVPRGFADRMQKRLDDPLLLQVLATDLENQEVLGFSEDPLEESIYNPLPGVVHKYHNRVLLIGAGACAVHCRYCFRRHFPYSENNPGKKGWREAQAYLKDHPEVDEVIFSGGDPLLLNNEYFRYLLDLIAEVPHIQTLRIHSRIPIVLPSRLETSWIDLMSQYVWKKVMVTHCNHAQELNDQVANAISSLKKSGWTVLNQSVLLKGINDNAPALVNLSKGLFEIGIMPYYLHILDKVKDVAHFNVSMTEALQLYSKIQSLLSGYLVPKLVQEVPGVPYKTLIKG